MLGFGFPGWDAITGVFKTIGGDIKDFVVRAVSDAIDWAIAGVTLVISGVEGALNDLRSLVEDFKSAIYAITDGLRSLAWNLWNDARHYADNAIAAAIAGLSFIAQPLVNLAELASGWIQQAFNMAINWASANIYWPLWHKIDDALSWVGTTFLATARALWSDAIDIAITPFKWIPQRFTDLWNWVSGPLTDAWKLIQLCWHFLEFVATHPFDWWMILLQDVAKRAPQWIFEHMASAVGEHSSAIEDFAVKVIG